jgi:putative membrane protein
VSQSDRAVGPPERLHPFFLLTGIGAGLRGMAGAYAVIAYLAVSGRLTTAIFGALAILAVSAVGLVLYWTRFEYRVGENEIRIDSGVFSRTHRSIPFDRVQDVDITQGPVARLLGLAQVRFETGGSAGKEEGVLQAIALKRAEQLRELVRSRRSRSTAANAAWEEEERPPIYAMDRKRLLLAGVFNFSLAVFAALFGLTQTVGEVIGLDVFSRTFWSSILNASEPVQRFILANQLIAAVAGLLSLLAVGVATGVVRTTLRDYGFRLDRTGNGLRRRRGLLTLTDVTLPARRAQAAIVGTGPVRDRFGWRELKLQSLARDEAGSGDHVLAPIAKDDEVGVILDSLGWRPLPPIVEWRRVSRAYVWALTAAVAPLLLVAAGQAAFMPWLGALTFSLLIGGVVLRWLAWRRTGYALDSERLLIRTGWWRRRILVLPIRRIQSIDLTQNFISRSFGTANLAFGVAGGGGFSAHEIPALHEEKARDLREQLLSRLL